MARFLIFAMLIYGTPFQQLIQSYQWNPRPLWDTLRGITDFISPRAAHAFTIDHYLGYKVKKTKDSPKFEPLDVNLADPFVNGEFTVKKPEWLYNPAEKTFGATTTPITDPFSHLVGYKIEPSKGCRGCEGGVSSLTLQYNGNETANILVTGKKNDVLFGPESAAPGGQFTVIGTDKDGKLGTSITITAEVNGEVTETSIHTSCSKPIGVGLDFGDFMVIGGSSLKGGELASCPSPVQNPSNCAACEGGVTLLTLRNDGPGAVITVKAGKGNQGLFNNFVAGGDLFTIIGGGAGRKLGTTITITVGSEESTLHTSCSQPIGPGLRVGEFLEVVEAESLKGGPNMCLVIRVANQFHPEGLVVSMKKADRLLVPSVKGLTGPVGEMDPTIEHFLCHQVKPIKGTFPEDLQVAVMDQFNALRLLDVDKPERLCSPVEKQVGGDVTQVIDRKTHLMCYKVKRPKGEPKHGKVTGIHTNNQFGPLRLEAEKVAELCVPSTIGETGPRRLL